MTRDEIIATVYEVVALANKRFNVNLQVPAVEFFNKGKKAGWAKSSGVVAFNETLALHNPVRFKQTIIHEIAHLVTWLAYPRAKQAHGPEFKFVDLSLGGRGTRCHSYDVSVSKVKKTYTRYVCACNCNVTHYVTKRVAVFAGRWRCKSCKGRLSYTGKVVKITK